MSDQGRAALDLVAVRRPIYGLQSGTGRWHGGAVATMPVVLTLLEAGYLVMSFFVGGGGVTMSGGFTRRRGGTSS